MAQPTPVEMLFRSLVDFNRSVRAQSQVWGNSVPGLSRSEVVVLGLLVDQEACRASAISDRMGVGPSVVSRLVASLDRRGLILRTADPDDGRAELLELTVPGHDALDQARTAYVESLTRRLQGWDTARIAAAAEVLEELGAALSARVETAPGTVSETVSGTAVGNTP